MTDLAARLRSGDRRALAQAITLIESERPDDQTLSDDLLQQLTAESAAAMRIGITGAPGVGKSTLIEKLGLQLCADGRRPAVLAVDPSSTAGAGAILGDKTRMEDLSRNEAAFIRPSPSGGATGGVGHGARGAILLCAAAGYDVILLESVGAGQGDTALSGICDLTVLVLAPGGGDELQGIKMGIVEHADLFLVNKADGSLAAAARQTAASYREALRLPFRARNVSSTNATDGETPPVLTGSAATGDGIAAFWQQICQAHDSMTANGTLASRRREQALCWLRDELDRGLRRALKQGIAGHGWAGRLEEDVRAGTGHPPRAARELLRRLFGVEAENPGP